MKPENFGPNLKRWLKQSLITQKIFCQEIGYRDSFMSEIFSAKKYPSFELTCKIIQFTGLTYEQLMSEPEIPTPQNERREKMINAGINIKVKNRPKWFELRRLIASGLNYLACKIAPKESPERHLKELNEALTDSLLYGIGTVHVPLGHIYGKSPLNDLKITNVKRRDFKE